MLACPLNSKDSNTGPFLSCINKFFEIQKEFVTYLDWMAHPYILFQIFVLFIHI